MNTNMNVWTQKRRVFIVDDQALVREWLTTVINQQPDLEVCGEAATAGQAMQSIAASKPEVATMEVSLKDCCGFQLIKELTRACPSLSVLVFSMHEEGVYAERALRAGAKGYIMKRETTQKVIEAIRRVLDGKFFLSDAVAQTITTQFVGGKTLVGDSLIKQLSNRELAVFELLGQGRGTRQIAETLCLSIKTVQTYCRRIKEKLNLNTNTELLREALLHRDERS